MNVVIIKKSPSLITIIDNSNLHSVEKNGIVQLPMNEGMITFASKL